MTGFIIGILVGIVVLAAILTVSAFRLERKTRAGDSITDRE